MEKARKNKAAPEATMVLNKRATADLARILRPARVHAWSHQESGMDSESQALALLALGQGANPRGQVGRAPMSFTFLVAALCMRAWDLAEALLDAGADPRSNTEAAPLLTPLWASSKNSRCPSALVERLLAAGADPFKPCCPRSFLASQNEAAPAPGHHWLFFMDRISCVESVLAKATPEQLESMFQGYLRSPIWSSAAVRLVLEHESMTPKRFERAIARFEERGGSRHGGELRSIYEGFQMASSLSVPVDSPKPAACRL